MPSLRKWLLSGLLVLVPLIITLWVLDWVVTTLDQTLHILPFTGIPTGAGHAHSRAGCVFALAVVLSIGAMASNIIGHKLVHWWHALLHRIPVVRSIYSGVKQVSDTLFSEKGNAFRKALLVSMAPRRHVDHRLPDRHPGRCGATCRQPGDPQDDLSVLCPPPPTRPEGTS
jgi:uncharacterized membrane protein